jgi:poly-gamma-glutamate capsule biosynthesis protein CapA/YwtB (metallophosphatase superfamily)
VDAGFDLVVGSHSHVLVPAEVYRGKLSPIRWGISCLEP